MSCMSKVGLVQMLVLRGSKWHIPFKKRVRVSLWEATHCKSASALQTRFEAAAVSCDGFKRG